MGNLEVTDLPAGEQEKLREDSVINTQDSDQVKSHLLKIKVYIAIDSICVNCQVSKMLTMQAYAKPHYLALGLTEDRRVDNIRDEDVKDLERQFFTLLPEMCIFTLVGVKNTVFVNFFHRLV